MARDLEQLLKQYGKTAAPDKKGGMPGGGPGGPHGRGPRPSGKPKNTGKTIARMFSYVAKYKFRLVAVAFFMVLSTATSLVGAYMLAPIIDRFTREVVPNATLTVSATQQAADSVIQKLLPYVENFMGSNVYAYILSAVIILGAVYIIGVISQFLQARIMLSVSQGAVLKIRNELFEKLQRLPVKYFDENPTGEVMSRFTNDIDNIDTMLNNSLTSLFSGSITLIGTFVFMLTTNWMLTLVTVVFIPLFIRGGGSIAKRSSKYYKGQQKALGAVNGYIEETVTGQKGIKVFNHEESCVEEFNLLNDDMRDKQFKAQFWGGVMGPIMGNTSQVSYGITVGAGGILMCMGMMTPGALTVFANYSKQFSMPINMISQQMSTVFAALAGAERVFDVMDREPEQSGGKNNISHIKGNVVFDNVTFGYNDKKTVLKNISLYAKPCQKIAFVGSTGAGKTTITNLLTRFYDIKSGTITIDGINIKDIDRQTLRENIAMVLQDTHLFTGTVMENIRYGRLDATDEEVINAAKLASAHSFIMRLSDGYNTMLSGDGANLSQGQRQLLNIARAALSKAPILVLDEATSSVDTRTERHIEHGMDRLMANRTTFVIAHRLSTVRNANAIMVLENGEIIERGTHDELLEQKGRYYELYTGLKELD